MANTLSTEAPTDFGGNFPLNVENPLKPRNFRVYEEMAVPKWRFDHFLIKASKAPFRMAYSR
jgi:hypothetical protein